jgi:iron complex transport system ATP-binding protein
VITADGVSFAYGGGTVLTDVVMTALPGEVVGLIGPNGSGKTTLLRTLYAALAPHAGFVAVDGIPLRSLRPRDVAQRVAVVAQEPASELCVTVAEMVLLGRSPHLSSMQRYSVHDRWLAAEALERVGVRELADRDYAALSGGEKQRVLIARSLAQETSHLLLDEPTNHLDVRYQHEILHLVRTLAVTTVVVLHDLNLAARYCDRLVLLERGRVVGNGTPQEVLTPETLEPLYGISVQRVTAMGSLQLIFSPLCSNAHGGSSHHGALS